MSKPPGGMPPFLSAGQVHGLVESLLAQLDQTGDSVRAQAYDWLAEKKRSYSGPAYLDQIEKNAVYLAERASLTNAASAHYLCMGQPILHLDDVVLYANAVGIDQAQGIMVPHLTYIRRGSCPGCELHTDHNRYTAWRDLRHAGNWPKYIEEMEFSSVYFQGLLIAAQRLLICLLADPQLAGVARGVSPEQVFKAVKARVKFRWDIWMGNTTIKLVQSESQTMPCGATNVSLADEHLDRAVTYAQQDYLDKAIREYQIALGINPNCAEAHYNLGLIYGRQGRAGEAILEYQAALYINPNLAEAHYSLGVIYGEQGRADEAVRGFQAALRINPGYAKAHCALGVIHGQQGHTDEAIREYQAALRINPDFADAHYNLGVIFRQQGRVDQAIREYQAALRINPGDAGAHYNLGVVYWAQGRADEAIREYQAALHINPNVAEVHCALGLAYGQQDRADEAIREYKAALRINPDYANAHCMLGWTYRVLQGRWIEAIREYQAALCIKPSFAEAHHGLSLIYGVQGRWDEAVCEAERAADLGFAPARELLVTLRQRAQQAGGRAVPVHSELGSNPSGQHIATCPKCGGALIKYTGRSLWYDEGDEVFVCENCGWSE